MRDKTNDTFMHRNYEQNINTPIRGFVYNLEKATGIQFIRGKNSDVRETSRNLIGCLEDWELEKPQIGVLKDKTRSIVNIQC